MRDETLARLAADTIAVLESEGMAGIDRFTFSGLGRPLRHEGVPYQGGNLFQLGLIASVRGYTSPYWMTFKQALEYKGCVRKGEKSSVVLKIGRVERDGPGGEPGGSFAFAKAYPVFNGNQIDGLPERFFPAPPPPVPAWEAHEAAERFVAASGAQVREGMAGPPCYVRAPHDRIHMPPRANFNSAEAWHATALHELVHWSGAAGRSERTKGSRFGDAAYALEELVAELGAAMLCGELGVSKTPRADHAHYLASWLVALRRDPKMLWTAGSAADAACAWLHARQPVAEQDNQAPPARAAAA